MILLARDIAKQIEAELEYPGQIKVNVIRESRVMEYAKQLAVSECISDKRFVYKL